MNLRELILIIIIICLSVALIFPYVISSRRRAIVDRLIRNGQIIYTSIIANGSVDDYAAFAKAQDTLLSADAKRFPTSTDYFRYMNTKGYRKPGWDVFSLKPELTFKGEDPEDFGRTNNTWCITSHIEAIKKETTPFLFTDNMIIDSYGEDIIPKLTRAKCLGKDTAVVITRGGVGLSISTENLYMWNTCNDTNHILRP